MKVLLSSNRNPHFLTITEYVEDALRQECDVAFFENRDFIIPGRIRSTFVSLQRMDLSRINHRLLAEADRFKPDIFLELGGFRILPETVQRLRAKGVKTVLWTIDPPRQSDAPVLASISYYDFIFIGGTEMYQYLAPVSNKNIYLLPFACDSQLHRHVDLDEKEKRLYGSDIVFVGSLNPRIYSYRVEVLEALSDFDLSLWGPGSSMLAKNSPLMPLVRGSEVGPAIWTKIYSASKIILCVHYKDPQGRFPCFQASPRVYEALACGAFLAVDDQKDVRTLFKDKEHLVVFKDINELRDILKYYLERPQEREEIARRGHREVLEKHTYSHRITEMLNIIKQ